MDTLLWFQSSSFPDENPRKSDFPSSKKPRTCDEFARVVAMPPPPNPFPDLPQNNRTTSLPFFKTRMCIRFRSGSCLYGANCHFAHGAEEVRRNVPALQEEEQQKINRHNICRLFYSGKGCTYGDTCHFAHVAPGTLMRTEPNRDRVRESSAICVRTVPAAWHVGGLGQSESINVDCSVGNSNVPNPKNIYWKTRLCTKWETTGRCPYAEQCQYAHGRAELRKLGSMDSDCINVEASASKSPCNFSKHDPFPNASGSKCDRQEQRLDSFKWRGLKRMSRIYADWIDDIPVLAPTAPANAEI